MKRNSNNGKDSSDQNSNTSDKQLQEYRQKKHSQQQKQLNQKRKEFIENFQRLHNEFKSLLIEISITTDPNDLAFLLVRLDTNIKGIHDLLKTTNDLEIDLDIKDLNAYATKCQNAVTNTQMLNAEVFNEFTHQLTDALAKFETKVIQLCGFSNNNNNNNNNNETANSDIDETNESPSTDTAYVPRMESDGADQGQTVTQTSAIENLPHETFLRILGFLSPVELSKLAPTSKHFKSLANDTSFLQGYKTIRGIKFSAAYSTMISKNGALLIFNTNACIYVFNIKKRTLIARLSSISNSPDITYMYSVISDYGKYVASYCRKKDTYYIQIWSIADKKLVKEFATSQIIKSLPDNLLRFSTIVFLSEQEIGILCEERNFFTHIGTHFIKFDIEKGITSECIKYTKFSSLQNIDANLVSNFCTLLCKEFFIWGYGEHEAKVIFKLNDGTDSEEIVVLSDIHFFKDKKTILCVLTNHLRQRHLVILDLNKETILRTLNQKSYPAQISAIRLMKNERYVAVCGGDHIRDSMYNTSDYFIEIHDLTKDINTCVKTLTVDGAHAVFFTEDELVVVGYEGINFFTFKDLNMEKNFEAVANKSNSSESNNDVNKKSPKLIGVPVKSGKQEESDDEDDNNNSNEPETNDGDQKLSKIPDEILIRIFGFLSQDDLNRSSLVNRQWSKVRKDRTLVKTEKISLSSLGEKLQSCSISHAQNLMIGTTNTKIDIWDITNFSLKATLQNNALNSYCAISDDGKYYAMTATDLSLIHKMEILDLTTQTITQSFKLVLFSNLTISGIKFTHDNKLLVLTNKTIQTYELNGTFVRSSEFGNGLKSISFSQNGTWSICRLSNNNLIIDKTCNFSKKASGSPNPLGLDLIGYDFACITNDGKLLISASAAGNGSFICLTDLTRNKELKEIVTPYKITNLDISPNGKYIVTSEFKKKSNEYILNIYHSTNINSNACILTIPLKHAITNVFFMKSGIIFLTTNDIHYIDPKIYNLDFEDDSINEAEITAMQSTHFNP